MKSATMKALKTMNDAKTAVKKAVVKPELKFVPLNFGFGTLPGCCGIMVPNSFSEITFKTDWYYNKQVPVPPQFATREDQVNDAINRWEEWGINNLYWYCTLSLVWKYKDGVQGVNGVQLPDLHEALLKRGYKVEREFVAPRHGNTLRVYTKLLSDNGEEHYRNSLEDDNGWDAEDDEGI